MICVSSPFCIRRRISRPINSNVVASVNDKLSIEMDIADVASRITAGSTMKSSGDVRIEAEACRKRLGMEYRRLEAGRMALAANAEQINEHSTGASVAARENAWLKRRNQPLMRLAAVYAA